MDARLVASRLPGIAMYGQPFNAPPFPGYLPYGPADTSAFYSPLQAGENADAWRAGLSQAAAAYYDPALAAHYGYGYGPMGLSDGARRKNATRETTSTLKAWLNEHRKNPYPTKGEKIMLAIITKMTLTQVSTWFANARRRLKKENKMTWSPRNRCGDEDDDDVMDDDNNLNNNSNNPNRDGLSSGHPVGESNGSRCSSPAPSNAPSDGPNRISSFDLPQNAHPFLSRPEINGSFGSRTNGHSSSDHHSDDGSRRRSQGDEDEEIDLESVEEDRKESAFVKRSNSSETQSHNESSASSQRRGPVVTSPSLGQPGPHHSIPGLFQNVPHHASFQPNVSNPALNHAAAASLLARHHIQPHVLGSLGSDPRNPQHRLHPSFGQQPSSFGPVGAKFSARRGSTSPTGHPYSRNAASSPTSSVASGSSAISSPSKPKIWSLADVATSNESSKPKHGEPTRTSAPTSSMSTSPTPGMAVFAGRGPAVPPGMPPQPPLNPEAQATIRNWMDGVMQQKMAAAAAAAAAMSGGQGHPHFFTGGLLPQHLAAALNPAALAVAASLPRGTDAARFQQPFPGFAELAAAQRAQMAAHVADMHAHHHRPGLTSSSSAPSLPTDLMKGTMAPASSRNRILSNQDDKARSPMSTSASPDHSMQTGEVAGFTPLNSRPDSSDSGIASAETSKDNLTQGTESSAAK